MGRTLIAATIYLSLFSYLLAVVCWITKRRGRRYRALWTAGCVLLCAHTMFAFHFHHEWSHTHAVAVTAEQTEAVLGVRFGNGIWFSYLLMVVWLIDVLHLWRRMDRESAFWSYFSIAVHAYAFFILFNGTVVFEDGAMRWAGVIGSFWVARLGWRYRRHAIIHAQSVESKA
jgi:hypothetical protein